MSAIENIFSIPSIKAEHPKQLEEARAELAALRARVAELEKPKTCASCVHLFVSPSGFGNCVRPMTIIRQIGWGSDSEKFGCIHHEPAPHPAP